MYLKSSGMYVWDSAPCSPPQACGSDKNNGALRWIKYEERGRNCEWDSYSIFMYSIFCRGLSTGDPSFETPSMAFLPCRPRCKLACSLPCSWAQVTINIPSSAFESDISEPSGVFGFNFMQIHRSESLLATQKWRLEPGKTTMFSWHICHTSTIVSPLAAPWSKWPIGVGTVSTGSQVAFLLPPPPLATRWCGLIHACPVWELVQWILIDTVDGRNPAPVNRWFIPLFLGFQPSKVVQDFFHPQ